MRPLDAELRDYRGGDHEPCHRHRATKQQRGRSQSRALKDAKRVPADLLKLGPHFVDANEFRREIKQLVGRRVDHE